MDHTRWELWRAGPRAWCAIRLGTGGKVRIEAETADERLEKCEAWEREHPEEDK